MSHPKVVLIELLELKKIIEKTLPGSHLVVSDLITQTNGNTSVAVIKPDEHLHGLELDVINIGN